MTEAVAACGHDNPEGAKFCNECGQALGTSGTPASDLLRSAADTVCAATNDMIDGGAELVSSPLAKKMAAGAAVGAVMAAPLPIIGWATGAVIGAGLVAFKHKTKPE